MRDTSKLKSVLAALEIERNQAKEAFVRAEEQRRAAEQAADQVKARLREVTARRPPAPTPTDLVVTERAARRLEILLENVRAQILQFDAQIMEPARERLETASRRCRSIELLIEKQAERTRVEERRSETKRMDESAAIRWFRHGS